jgi:hypothetical protein
MGGDSPSPAPPPAQSYLNLGPVDAARVTTRQHCDGYCATLHGAYDKSH